MNIVITDAEGNESEVSIDNVKFPEGHSLTADSEVVHRDTLRHTHVKKSEFDRRFKSWVPKDSAAEDEGVIAAVLSQHKSTPDIAEAKAAWEKSEVNPLKEKLAQFKSSVVRGEVLAEASKHFDERFVTSPAPGIPSFAETALLKMFDHHDDTGYVVAMSPDGDPELSTDSPTSSRPYMGVQERFKKLVQDPAWAPYLKEPPKNDSGTGFAHNSSNGAARSAKSRSEMSISERAAYASEHGPDAYMALPE